MGEPVDICCPYCGEWQTVWLDPDSIGEMTHDCGVCCQPWRLFVHRSADGQLTARADRSS